MAEYYPLLAKAIAGLPNATPETRRAVYDRARKALIAQLRSLDPPIPESDVTRETDALTAAVARLEAELTRKNGLVAERAPAAAQTPAPQPASAASVKPSLTQTVPSRFAPPPNGAAPGAKDQAAPGKMPPLSAPLRAPLTPQRSTAPTPGLGTLAGATKPGGLMTASAAAPAAKVAPSPSQKIAAPGAQDARPSLLNPSSPNLSSPNLSSLNGGARMPGKPLVQPAPPPPMDEEEHEDAHEHEHEFDAKSGLQNGEAVPGDEDDFDTFEEPRVEAVRLYAPQPDEEDKRSRFRLWLVSGIVAVVVVIVAVAAWTLRDRPDELAKLKPADQSQTDQGGKIAERIGPNGQSEDAQQMSPNDSANPNGTNDATAQAPAPADQTQANAAAAANQQPNPGTNASGVPVSYRAALLVEAPEEANKVKTYLGSVVWRLDNVSGGSGQTVGTAVHADVDIPDDKWKVTFTMQKNTDPSLPASHTITINFYPAADSPSGGVKQINVVQMRQDNTPRGNTLIGVPVTIMDNSFLVGLTRGSAETTNLDLIKNRPWFDIPIALTNGKIAKLTFEKGASGSRAVDDALASWQSQ